MVLVSRTGKQKAGLLLRSHWKSPQEIWQPNTSQLGSHRGLEGFHWSGFSFLWGRARGVPAVSVELLSALTSTQAENPRPIPNSKRPLKLSFPLFEINGSIDQPKLAVSIKALSHL